MNRLLFVCSGNTCRSPMAEAMARSFLRREGKDCFWSVASAGLAAFPGDEAAAEARDVMAARGLSLDGHRSRRLSVYDVDEARWILTMTFAQRQAVRGLYPEAERRIRLLAEAASDEAASVLARYDEALSQEDRAGASRLAAAAEVYDIPDPFGGAVDSYRFVASRLESLLDLLVKKL
ncbi:MAG: low molecular weight protein arginine phosphatase [Synergistaceae bacterium]|nr:low molecular weight protein arginine phosphatase [Synergistaceae bacterium]